MHVCVCVCVCMGVFVLQQQYMYDTAGADRPLITIAKNRRR